jgi:multidrug resistance efflux pump
MQKQEQIRGVDHKVERTQIVSRLDGVVTEVHKKPGEWVNLGDTVCHVMRLDRLHVKGRVNVKDFSPKALLGRAVAVAVTLDGNRRETFEGKLTYISPKVGYDGEKFEVWAEVVNRKLGEQWELRPGMLADMTINGIEPGLQVTRN